MSARAQLIADIQTGQAESDPFIQDGWLGPEGGHRWTVGQESRIRLPVDDPGPDYIVCVHMAPWCDPAALPAQTVMLAVNGRLLATVQFDDQRVFAWRLPAGLARAQNTVLSFTHLSSRHPRPAGGQDKTGQPLGVMVLSIRVFRLPATGFAATTRPGLAGTIESGTLPKAVLETTGLDPEALANRFEGLGQDCEFGLVQRAFGAEPISLLRFTGVTTYHLADGLVARFDGIGAPETTFVYIDYETPPQWRVNEKRYFLWYGTGQSPDTTPREKVLHEQCRRLAFLRRKFLEDVREGRKIFVVSRGESLCEPEALAVYCALNLEGSNTLLWTVHGDASQTGRVDALMPGFLRGHLGILNEQKDGTLEAWLSVLANAYRLTR